MLTRRQGVFAEEYLVDLNATQAACRAGYSAATAAEQGSRLLAHDEVAEAISRGMAQRAARTKMQQDVVIDELAHIAFSDVNHFRVDDDTGDLTLRDGAPLSALAAVQSIRHRKRVRIETNGDVLTTYDSEVRLWDKVAALRLLGKHIGLFADRVEHPGPNVGPIESVVRIERVILADLLPGALKLPVNTE